MSDECHFISVKNDTREWLMLKAVAFPNIFVELKPVGPNEKVVNDLRDYPGPGKFFLVFNTRQDEVRSKTILIYNRNIDVTANFTVTAGDPFTVTFNGLEK